MKRTHIIGTAIIIILIIFLSMELDEKERLQIENKKLKEEKLQLIKAYLSIAKEIPTEIKQQLERLVQEYDDIDPDVARELIDVLNLIEQGMETKAIAALTKIIENLLKDKFAHKMLEGKYSDEVEFQKKKERIKLVNVIDFAKSEKFFTDHEFNLSNLLREFRNNESHKLSVQLGANWKKIAFLTGIEIVFKLTVKV